MHFWTDFPRRDIGLVADPGIRIVVPEPIGFPKFGVQSIFEFVTHFYLPLGSATLPAYKLSLKFVWNLHCLREHVENEIRKALVHVASKKRLAVGNLERLADLIPGITTG